jgi:hypothetical protein
MISEVVNALCITYIATEYTLASCNSTTDGRQSWWKIFSRAPKQQHLIGIVVIVVLINILDRVSGAAEFANSRAYLHQIGISKFCLYQFGIGYNYHIQKMSIDTLKLIIIQL